jgi:ubiquinone/menaquinone biosynthesis C-methylase UbiE
VTTRVLQNRERYDRRARTYEALVRFGSFGQFERFDRAIAAELDPCPGGTILDLGCGLGTLVPHLLPRVAPGGAAPNSFARTYVISLRDAPSLPSPSACR